jgi:SAM-dependent methyltransferase
VNLGDVFTDPAVARAYRQRAPYPPETFAILERLVVEPRTVLDAGAGNGALARSMIRFARRVDAVDPSVAMIDEGRRLPGGDDPRLHWITGTAEEAPLDPPYGLISAGSSLHWMDQARVVPRFAAALAPGARLAILETDDGEHPLPEMVQIFERYSELTHHTDLPDMLSTISRPKRVGCRHGSDAALEASGGWFVREGEQRTAAIGLRRSVEEYLEYLHSTSTLARVRLGDRADRFDADVRDLFARHGMSFIERQVVGVVVWGRPVAP